MRWGPGKALRETQLLVLGRGAAARLLPRVLMQITTEN